jgi:hypothetical protein
VEINSATFCKPHLHAFGVIHYWNLHALGSPSRACQCSHPPPLPVCLTASRNESRHVPATVHPVCAGLYHSVCVLLFKSATHPWGCSRAAPSLWYRKRMPKHD